MPNDSEVSFPKATEQQYLCGYEHGSITRILAGEEPTVPIPDFEDAYNTQRVLEASLLCAEQGHPINMDDVK